MPAFSNIAELDGVQLGTDLLVSSFLLGTISISVSPCRGKRAPTHGQEAS